MIVLAYEGAPEILAVKRALFLSCDFVIFMVLIWNLTLL